MSEPTFRETQPIVNPRMRGMQVCTEVRGDGVYVQVTPYRLRRIGFEEIESMEVRTYRALAEWSGRCVEFLQPSDEDGAGAL
jgi:hypothetical protein